MSLLKRWGLVEDDKPKEEVKQTAPVVAQPSVVVGTGAANDELIAKIIGNVRAKTADNAYYKLRDSMDLMMAGKLDECSAAKGSAAVLGLKLDGVASAIDQAISLVEGERALFAKGPYAEATGAADKLVARSTDLQAQINGLLDQVKQLSEENVNTQQESTRVRNEAEVMVATFDASAMRLNNMLTAEKQKLTTYLS